MDEESQVYFIDSDQLPPEALKRKHQLETDPSVRSDHMKYFHELEVLDSDVKDIVLLEFAAYDYDRYTAADVRRALSH
ncbi:MAG: 2-iminoacetate synthase ThiH, partial [Clostridiales bacterium]|nr:2-iminoacetate synthase ThiH [Clostridiales bacterium]